MEGKYNKVLTRHLQKYWNGEPITAKMEALLEAIDQSFRYYERDHELLDRAMELSSKELTEAYQKIKHELQEKKIAQERVKQNEQILSSINQNLREAIYRGSFDGSIIFVNQAFAELFGYSSIEEILPVSMETLYVSAAERKNLIDRVIREGSAKSVEVLLKKKDGSEFWGLISCSILRDHLGNSYFDGAVVDITAQKQHEKILMETNAMLQKTNEELDRFVYSASHDLRAPLMSLLGLINILELEKPENQGEYLEMMKKSILKLDHFIKDIIDYSRNSRLTPAMEPIDFEELLNEIFAHFQYMEMSSGIEKLTEFQFEAPFYSDKKRLTVVLNNLISNSIRYHNAHQPAPFIKVSIRTTASSCFIEVADNGIGIDPAHHDKIFRMFYRATSHAVGSGLGLYIVKEVVDKLAGTIEVRSKIGDGTTFLITIPNTDQSRKGMSPASISEAQI